jgi:hypothetical protein
MRRTNDGDREPVHAEADGPGPDASGAPGDWEASDEAQYRAVEEALENRSLRKEVDELRQAMATHPTIDMARGIVMAAGPCSAEEAWQVLVEVSQHTNVKLREIATAIVESVEGPPPAEPVQHALREALVSLRERRGPG